MATLQKKVDINSTGDVIYTGWAEPGTATSSASWRIKKTVITAPDDDVEELFANNSSDFVHIWDDRTSLSYSI